MPPTTAPLPVGMPPTEDASQSSRFTHDGSDAAESAVAHACDLAHLGISQIIPPYQLRAILLTGPFGRGEGGSIRTDELERPGGTLEFRIFLRTTRTPRFRFARSLHRLSDQLTRQTGMETEFHFVHESRLRRGPPSLDVYELVSAHRWIVGNESQLLDCERHRDPSLVPTHEATRLLLNRCSGLLLGSDTLTMPRLEGSARRRLARLHDQLRLALGDAILLFERQYHWSLLERSARLRRFAESPEAESWATPELSPAEILRFHQEGVERTLHPVSEAPDLEEFRDDHRRLSRLAGRLWLRLEGKRLGHAFASPRDYAMRGVDKCPETSAWRNRLLNFRTFRLKTPLCSKGARHPRERLLHALPLLLWEYPSNPTDPGVLAALRWELLKSPRNLSGWIRAYQRLWKRFG